MRFDSWRKRQTPINYLELIYQATISDADFHATVALAQAALAVFRALQLFDVGADLLGRGIILLPFVGVIAFARGALVIILAMLYVLFAVGMFVEKSWAWWLGLIVSAINFLLVINVVVQGESVSRADFG